MDEKQQQPKLKPLAVVAPNKPIAEMTSDEIDQFADDLFDSLTNPEE